MNKVPQITLNNGIEMPQLGLGVWRVQDGEEVVKSVSYALSIGYRAIDTAAIYGNEQGVGEAIRNSGIKREDLFITTKLWNSDQGYESAFKAFNDSLSRLGLDYVDLYLIHWPNRNSELINETWRAFEKLYADKKTKAIGVSNFKPTHLKLLLQNSKIIPAVNQIELHPYMAQPETRDFCKKNQIAIESWSPLMHAGTILEEVKIINIAKRLDRTPAQVVLRWHIQSGLIVIPKSVTTSRIKENFELFDFELSPEDMKQIDSLDRGERVGSDPDSFGLRVYSSISKTFGMVRRKNRSSNSHHSNQ